MLSVSQNGRTIGAPVGMFSQCSHSGELLPVHSQIHFGPSLGPSKSIPGPILKKEESHHSKTAQNPRSKNTKIYKRGGLKLPDIKTNYKATVIKTVWYYKDIDQQSRVWEERHNIYGQLIFNNSAKKGQSFSKKRCRNNLIYMRKKKISTLIPYKKINLKWIIDVIIKVKTLARKQKKIFETLDRKSFLRTKKENKP